MSPTNYARYKYIPDEMGEKEFLERFVVRTEIFQELFDDIENADYGVPNQHYIIVGQRGQGKTTLLRKIYLEVQNAPILSPFLLPVKFAEEQYQIRSLCRLWEEVADYLHNFHEEEFRGLVETMESHVDDDDYDLRCFSYLETHIKASGKKLLLLIDNIDELLGKLKEKEQRQLREILLSSSSFRIIGGSTKMIEQHYDYAQPFYEFFKIIQLQGLNHEESISFLRAIGQGTQKEEIEHIIQNTPERIETLRRLTGGVPRTLVMLFDVFVDDEGNAFEDLLKILDEATPLYKDRMDSLPPVLQDIVHTIAMNWDGITTKEIAKKTRLESKAVSAQLKQLEKYQMIETESIGKNNIYKLRERFFNIWYLMRFGRKKDRQRVEWLVKFLLSWYSHNELETKADTFVKSLQNGSMKEAYAYYMCEALSYTGLDYQTEHLMKMQTRDFLNSKKSELANELSKTDIELLEKSYVLYKENRVDDALKLLLKSKKESAEINYMIGFLYKKQKEYVKAELYYLKAIENGSMLVLNHLGVLYSEQKKYDKAEEYYLKAVESNSTDALYNLGVLYGVQDKYDKAEKYYLKAIESGSASAMNNLGALYSYQKKYDKAEALFLKAIESGSTDVLINLGNLYKKLNKYTEAEAFYLKAVESASPDAMNNLGVLYKDQNKYAKAEEYYLKAIESGNTDALHNLGNLYKKQNKYTEAEDFYLKAAESGSIDALHNLGVLYSEQKEYTKAELFYLKAAESGSSDAMNNLGILYRDQNKYAKAEKYYLIAIENGSTVAMNNLGALYSEQKKYDEAEVFFLKAVKNGSDDALHNLGILYSEQNEYDKAEIHYFEAAKNGNSRTLNGLAWFYFEQSKERDNAVEMAKKSVDDSPNYFNTHTLAVLLLWAEAFSQSDEMFLKWLGYEQAADTQKDVIVYFNLLMAKGQYYQAKKLMEMPEYQLKERYKPVWYALMSLMQKEFPNEIKKMGSELQESVTEVLAEVERYREKYAL